MPFCLTFGVPQAFAKSKICVGWLIKVFQNFLYHLLFNNHVQLCNVID